MSLSSTSSLDADGETWKLLLVYCSPIYPSHWLPAASELTLSSSPASQLGRSNSNPTSMTITGSRKSKSLVAAHGWISDDQRAEMEAEWARKMGSVDVVETDGKFLVAAAGKGDNTLQVYRLHYRGELKLQYLRTLEGHPGGIAAMKVADGRCVSVGRDGRLKVWDLEAGWDVEVDPWTYYSSPEEEDVMDALTIASSPKDHEASKTIKSLFGSLVHQPSDYKNSHFPVFKAPPQAPPIRRPATKPQSPASMEYDSDLTDLSEEYAPGPSNSKKTTTARPGYKPRNVLRPPKTSTYSAWSLYEWIQNGGIELEPEYQRDVVWPDSKQTKLIDSILRNFYIPPIIFRVLEDQDGYERRICIDGKQRLTSLQRFMDGIIPHIDADDKKKHWFKAGTGKRNVLPDWLISTFKQKQLVCVEYFDLDGMWEREIFQRVQLGMPLQPAERMAAHVGPWAMFATTIKQQYFGPDSDMWKYWSLDISRARDFQYAAQIIMGVYSLPDRCNFATQSLDKWLQRTDPPSESFKKQVRDVFDKLVAVGPYNLKKAVAPVEFVMTAILISMNPNANTEKLGDLITQFRAKLKKDHVDLRANSRVIKSAYESIEAQLGSSLQVAYARGSKRKNTADEDDDDDEYRGSPVTKMSRHPNTRQVGTRGSTASSKTAVSSQASKSATPAKPPTSAPSSKLLLKAGSSSKPAPISSPSTSSRPSSSTNAHTHLRPDGGSKELQLDGIARLRQLQAQSANKVPSTSLAGDLTRRSSLGVAAGGSGGDRISPVVPNPNSFIATNGYRPPAVPATTPTTNESNVQGDLMDWFGDPSPQTASPVFPLDAHERMLLTTTRF
ncbi:hypothetical protein FRC01_003343 [Tulasnella sp. 417]|nr:hypothetical protein FRC01_003343 [Tulasnella sp. 417]